MKDMRSRPRDNRRQKGTKYSLRIRTSRCLKQRGTENMEKRHLYHSLRLVCLSTVSSLPHAPRTISSKVRTKESLKGILTPALSIM